MRARFRNVAFMLAIASTFVLAPRSAAAADAGEIVRTIVAAKSHASFTVTHLLVQRVTGTVPVVAGRVTFPAADAAVPTSVVATLDPKAISTGDRDRDDDLHGPDWFDTARFPTWTFASTAIAATVTGFTMSGNLTVHGVTRPVALEVVRLEPGAHSRYRATGTLDRHGFDMHVTPFDGAIGNQLDIELDVVLE